MPAKMPYGWEHRQRVDTGATNRALTEVGSVLHHPAETMKRVFRALTRDVILAPAD